MRHPENGSVLPTLACKKVAGNASAAGRLHRLTILVSLFILQILSVDRAKANQHQTRGQYLRAVTIADIIGMTRLGFSTNLFDGAAAAGRTGLFSPDGKKFLIVVRRGNLEKNTNDYSLLQWSITRALDSSPAQLLTMRSSSIRPAIQAITWLADNETIAFLGERPGELQQLYLFNTRTRRLRKLTHHTTNLISFSIAGLGEEFAFAAEPPQERYFDDERARHQGIVVSNQLITTLISGIKSQGRFEGEAQIFAKTRFHPLGRVEVPGRVPVWRETPFLSPTGRYIVIASRVSQTPKSWHEYTDAQIREFADRELEPGEFSLLDRYVLLDLKTGTSQILLNSPLENTAAWSEVAWSPDGHSVVLAGIYLPLDGVSGDERERRKSSQYVVEVEVPAGNVIEISHEDLKLLKWDPSTAVLVFAPGKLNEQTPAGKEIKFEKKARTWKRLLDSEKNADSDLEIVTEEDMNTPPKLFLTDPATLRRKLLLDLNPQFAQLTFGKVEEIEWTATDGTKVRGGLYYPVGYLSGKKYPLVIQTHGWRSSSFWIDGPPWSSGFAAQALAGRGVMVLQSEQPVQDLDQWWNSIHGRPKEVQTYQAIYEGAIDYLDKKGLIDRARIGIVGFSRTCYYVKYMLTHSTYHFLAASVTDGIDGGYFQYIGFSNIYPQDSEGINAGVPFGKQLKEWMEHSPGFNTDKVDTPVRIMSLDHTSSLLGEWEWFAALHRQKKPVEMVTIEDDDHVLVKPWNRLISQQGTVDWFCFWLEGKEDPDPAKAGQYERWRMMRSK